MPMSATATMNHEGITKRKREALLNNAIQIHNYQYSDEVHGYVFMIEDTLHFVLNSRKPECERLATKQRLMSLAYRHADKAMVLLYGAERKSLLAPYHDGDMKMNIFQLQSIIENLHRRGVQDDSQAIH